MRYEKKKKVVIYSDLGARTSDEPMWSFYVRTKIGAYLKVCVGMQSLRNVRAPLQCTDLDFVRKIVVVFAFFACNKWSALERRAAEDLSRSNGNVVKFSYQLFKRPFIDDDNEPTECARFGRPTAPTTTIERSNRDHWFDRVMTRSDYLVLDLVKCEYFDPLISDLIVWSKCRQTWRPLHFVSNFFYIKKKTKTSVSCLVQSVI